MTLVVCDVDGTLVDKDKKLTPATIAAVGRLRAAGIGFTIISARPMSGIRPILDALDLDVPVGAFNGGIVFGRDGSVAQRETVPAEVARGVFEIAKDASVDRWVFADDVWYASSTDGPHLPSERLASNQEPVIRDDFDDLLDCADKITFVSDDEALLRELTKQAEARFGEAATIVQSQTYYLDVTAKAANKGDGIAALADAIGTPLDRTIAIGDQANDLAMFARAGRSIAMGNAAEAVKAKAGDVTRGNDADGVVYAIDHFILGRMM
ncbi:HAD family phosphatase [Sphingomonas sp. NBWT7]|uniref:Cof-type HAD-IIB family hydrolase n=1 Tax=Sphingomonas sp. NBWT7 TaxID=2596913 RepID=UPI001625102D|nr:Cof-type HAD-IIB family hydrolase [Sphingomonas sp. NBWT7]QNE31801.1 HAD family phosphatase [Sphingomonas sp. NBWT7]